VWVLAQSRGDGHRSLVTPERVLSEINEDLIFFAFHFLLSFVNPVYRKIAEKSYIYVAIKIAHFDNHPVGKFTEQQFFTNRVS